MEAPISFAFALLLNSAPVGLPYLVSHFFFFFLLQLLLPCWSSVVHWPHPPPEVPKSELTPQILGTRVLLLILKKTGKSPLTPC